MSETKKALAPVVTTMRFPPEVMRFAADAAADRGLSRTQYIMQLIIQDAKKSGKRFSRLELRPKLDDAVAALYD